jgi:replicative DNA helicase
MDNDYFLEITALSCAILSKTKLSSIMELSEDDFYNIKTRQVFICIKELYNTGKIIDLMSVRNKLNENRYNIQDTFLAKIMGTYPVMDVGGLVSNIKKYTQKRSILSLKNNLDDFEKSKINNEKIVNDIYEKLENIQKSKINDFSSISDYTINDIEDFQLKESDYSKTGFVDLDKRLFGLVNGELTILGARPGLGKSSLALNIALNISKRKRVLYISLEMPAKQQVLRALSSASGVDSYLIRHGKLNDEQCKKIFEASKALYSLNLNFVDDSYSFDVLMSKIRKYHSMFKDVVIIIDYVQLIKVPWVEQKRLQVAEVSGTLKNYCNTLNIPVIALAQLSRMAEDNVPKLSYLKEAGDLEQDADNVIFLHNTLEMGDVYDVIIAKGRNCGFGNFKLMFDRPTTTFFDYYAE